MMAQIIAIMHPELVDAMVLASTTSCVDDDVEVLFESWVELAKEGKASELMDAFAERIYTEEETGFGHLPGRDGSYFRASCNAQMLFNEEHAKEGIMPEVSDRPAKIIKYCRNCELLCAWPPREGHTDAPAGEEKGS